LHDSKLPVLERAYGGRYYRVINVFAVNLDDHAIGTLDFEFQSSFARNVGFETTYEGSSDATAADKGEDDRTQRNWVTALSVLRRSFVPAGLDADATQIFGEVVRQFCDCLVWNGRAEQ
jgi:hypothetical protein